MQCCWLSRTGQPSCLLFFAGWGMDPEPFRPIAPKGHDLLMFYDYRDLAIDPATLLPQPYRRHILLAWSMGVWVAGRLLADNRDRLGAAVAVNGTLTPIDDRCGIAAQAYDGMLQTFSASALDDFYRSMFADQGAENKFLANRPRRPPAEIKAELAALREAYLLHGPAADIYTSVLAGSRDRVFVSRAQLRSWGRERCRLFAGPHFPFYAMDWDDLLREDA